MFHTSFLRAAVVFPVLIVAGTVGCGGPKVEPTFPFTATVNLDGKPLSEGKMVVRGSDGKVPAYLEIKDGAVSGSATAGKKVVEISAFRLMKNPPKPIPGMAGTPDNMENYIPKRYNSKSQLELEIKPGGQNEGRFELTSLK
ncbi:MAG: hypothetical protein ACRDD1_15510 [Planctomycetia bacterium]